MKKITVIDKNQNKHFIYKNDEEADPYIDCNIHFWGLPDEVEIKIEEMTIPQIQAWQYLNDTDWFITRFLDPSSGELIPDEVLTARADARNIL